MAFTVMCSGFLAAMASTWFYQVATHVPDPYLDEVFHVRQALVYYSHQFRVWDPKITTPPGLYIFSYPGLFVLQALRVPGSQTVHLRALNLLETVFGLYFAASSLSKLLHRRRNGTASSFNVPAPQSFVDHTALNMALFPPLFFFSALYYTDVMSIVTVLHAYEYFLQEDAARMVMYSFMALSLRQTNIFWTAVWLGGLEAVRILNASDGNDKRRDKQPRRRQTWREVVGQSWSRGTLYDPLVSGAWLEDYLKSSVSLALASVTHISVISSALLPYMSILVAFACFVAWNGGVVLGDKSNHVATLHLPQMLYIWPYITFFSFPMLLPYFLSLLGNVPFLGFIMNNRLIPTLSPDSTTTRPRLLVAIPTILVMSAVVRLNTIVHPFTLADNRHYTFYVFRLLLRHPAVKYMVTPVYFICSWAAIQALGGPVNAEEKHSNKSQKKTTRNASQAHGGTEHQGQHVSFVLVFLLSTTLSLVTAPLVEPRYFIIPWCIWRLNVPFSKVPSSEKFPSAKMHGYTRVALVLETMWHLIINLGAGYMFLHRTFTWPSEPGQLQRFMW